MEDELDWLDAPREPEPRFDPADEAALPGRYVHQATKYKDLNPKERRVALMRAAGASEALIAQELESDSDHVRRILARPQVAKAITRLTAQFATEAAPIIRDLNAEIEAVAADAFDRLRRNMKILDEVGDERLEADDFKNGIRAKLGCVATTQDILDRAGKRAPTRTVGAVMHVIAPEQLEKLERIICDSTTGGGVVGVSAPGAIAPPAEGGGADE